MMAIDRPRMQRNAAHRLARLGAATGALMLMALSSSFAQEATPDSVAAPVVGAATLPRDLSPWGMFMSADTVVQGYDRPCLRVGRDLDGLARQDDRDCRRKRRARAALRKLAARARSPTAGSAPSPAAEFLAAARGELQLSADVRQGRHQGASRLAAGAHRGGARPPHRPRHRRAGDDRRDSAVRRSVRHRVGHHEQLHRHLEVAHHQSRGGRARHRRGAACHGVRACRRHPGGGDLQLLCALDRRLPGAARRRVRRGAAACQPRSRPPRARPHRRCPTPAE